MVRRAEVGNCKPKLRNLPNFTKNLLVPLNMEAYKTQHACLFVFSPWFFQQDSVLFSLMFSFKGYCAWIFFELHLRQQKGETAGTFYRMGESGFVHN